MARLGRRSAGEQVVARAQRLSDDLLAAEVQCFAEIEMAFGSGAATVETALRRRWFAVREDPKALLGDRTLRSALGLLHAQTMADARASVAGLATLSVAWSLEAIEDELVVCESTLGKRYAGVAVQGVEMARDASEKLVTLAMEGHERQEGFETAAFAGHLQNQLGIAAARGETLDTILLRVLSPKPVTRHGIGGRGVWWRSMTGLNASSRAVSIGLSNAVREAAMSGMNIAAEARPLNS